MTTSLRGARPIGRASSDLFRGARELERKGFNGQALAEQAALTKLKEPRIYRDGERDAERSATERMQTGLLAERRDASLEARGVTVEATGSKLAARQGLFKEAQDAGSFTPEMKTRGAALGISESGFAQAQSRMKPPVSQPSLGTAGSPPPAATSGESPVVKKPLAERDATSSVPILGGVLNTPVDPVSKINGVAGSSVLAGMNSDANRREGGDRARNNIATMGQAGAVADYFKRKDQPAEPGNLAELKARDAADSPSPASTIKGPLQTAMEEARASRERREVTATERAFVNAPRTFDWRNTSDHPSMTKEANASSADRLNARQDASVIPGYSAMQEAVSGEIVADAINDSETRQRNSGIAKSSLPKLTTGLTASKASPLGPTPVGRTLVKPAATPPAPAAEIPRGRLNVTFGPYKNTDTTFLAARDKARAKDAAEDAKNRELSTRQSNRPGLLTRMGLRKPPSLNDTYAGKLFDATNK